MDAIVEEALRQLEREIGAIAGAPMLSAALFVLGILLAWLVLRIPRETRPEVSPGILASNTAHIKLLESQLNEYKTKLNGASPDEVAQEIQRLGADLLATKANLEVIKRWYQHHTSERHLTPEQERPLFARLTSLPPSPVNQFIGVGAISDPEAQQYAVEIMKVFQEAGLCTGQSDPFRMPTPALDQRGLLIVIANKDNPLPHAVAVFEALMAVGIKAKYVTRVGPPDPLSCNIVVSYKASGS